MTWYRDIQPLGEPFGLDELDEAGRVQLVFRLVATKRASETFLQELMTILERANVGRRKVDIIGGTLAPIPASGRYLLITVEAGPIPIGTHSGKDAGIAAYRRPAARILIGAASMPEAEAMAQAAYKALSACRNRNVEAPS